MADKQHLMIVEDDPIQLELLAKTLQSTQRYKITPVCNANEAIEIAIQCGGVDLILADYEMEPINGIDMMRQIQHEVIQAFVMITAHIDEDLVREAGRVGAQAYLVKPVAPETLIAQVEIALINSKNINNLRNESDVKKTISVAIGIISERFKITPEKCYELLRKKARSQRIRLAQLATNIIEKHEDSISKLRSEIDLE